MSGGGYVYNSSPVKERLRAHNHTPDFLNDFAVYVGGSLHPDHGGDWERMKRANKWLGGRETNAPKADVQQMQAKIAEQPYEQRQMVNGFAAAAGVGHTWDFPALTDGELLFFQQLGDLIAMSEIDDIVECISFAFPGTISPALAASRLDLGALLAKGAPEPELSAPPKRKVVRVVETDLSIPPGYLDDTDLSGSAADVKKRINTLLHAHLIAEIEDKNRKTVVDWLIGKLKGFKVPEEMRTYD
jgi:hypothetical protein